jgi:acetyl esterase/lipase
MTQPFSGPVDRDTIIARIEAHPVAGPPRAQRSAFAELVLGSAPASQARAHSAGGGESLRLGGVGGTIVYFHGGGYVFGSVQTHARIGRGLAAQTGLGVILPAYPLAPEHPWPAQLDAAMAAVADAPGPVVLAGDSAGGHLALVATLELSRRGRRPAGLILFSPNTDRTGLSATRERNGPTDPMVDDAGDHELARQCFGGRPVGDPAVSPVLDDLRLLPPLHVEVGGGEVLLGDSLVVVERARRAGITVALHIEAGGLHMMQLWAPWWDTAAASLERAAAFARWRAGRADRPGTESGTTVTNSQPDDAVGPRQR